VTSFLHCCIDLPSQDLFGTLSWINVTAESKGNVAGFVDFDWGANLCPDQTCSADMKVSRGLCQTMLVATDFFICGILNGTSSLTCVLLKVSDTTILATVYDKPGDYDQVGGWLILYLSMTCMPAFTPGCS